MIKKQLYEAPATEVLELRLEGNVLQLTSGGNESVPEEGGEW